MGPTSSKSAPITNLREVATVVAESARVQTQGYGERRGGRKGNRGQFEKRGREKSSSISRRSQSTWEGYLEPRCTF